jgi:acetyl-CoA carboxylase alpha subunit
LKKALRKNLERLTQIPLNDLSRLREKKFREIGKVVEERA